jgi:hypothetical protein
MLILIHNNNIKNSLMRVLSYQEYLYKKLGVSRQTYNTPGFLLFCFRFLYLNFNINRDISIYNLLYLHSTHLLSIILNQFKYLLNNLTTQYF